MATLTGPEGRRGPRTRTLLLIALPIALILSAVIIWQASYATFSRTTDNPGNTFSSGTVSLTDDDNDGTAMFAVSGLVPSNSGSTCIKVSYGGNVASAGVKLYIKPLDLTAASADIAPYLKLTVERGTGGSFKNCAGFTPAETVTPAITLDTFAADHDSYADGFGSWAPATAADAVYKFSYVFDAAAPNSAMGKTAEVTFTWETQS